jgi:hypothetical protein
LSTAPFCRPVFWFVEPAGVVVLCDSTGDTLVHGFADRNAYCRLRTRVVDQK